MSERDMNALIRLLEQQLGVQWADVQEWLRSRNGLAEIEAKLVAGRLNEVLFDVTAAAQKFAAEVNSSYLLAGQRSAAYLDSKVADTLIHFDSAHPLVVQRQRANSLEQVQGLVGEARAVVRQVLVEGSQTGAAPRATARRIRDSIGLTAPQERALTNYRTALEAGDWSKAMGYELRDGRADRSMRSGMDLSQQQIDSLADRYRTNQIAHRAETIARTESLRVAHEGASDAIVQAIQRGDIDADQLVKEWHAGPATRYARPEHRHMNGQTVGVLDDFVLPDGTHMSHPGDARGGAAHVANCRCTTSTTFRLL